MSWSIPAIAAITAWILLRILCGERQRHLDDFQAALRQAAQKAAEQNDKVLEV
ncbi:MAG TPA: hypothetical protein VKK61_08680 [Tepidisphaeraceae bacterium]|nr:hypothetical protein [Tepidisphaeraceae bacterium]